MVEPPQAPAQSLAQVRRAKLSTDSHFDYPIRLNRMEKVDGPDYATVPAIDWNSGSSRLDAWLNQSAMPQIAQPSLSLVQINRPEMTDKAFASKEAELLKVCRNIHLKPLGENAEQTEEARALKDNLSTKPREQIYSRNITDRYPDLPNFLITGLARASCERAEHLSRLRNVIKLMSLSCRPCRRSPFRRKARKTKGTRVKSRGTRQKVGTEKNRRLALDSVQEHSLLIPTDGKQLPQQAGQNDEQEAVHNHFWSGKKPSASSSSSHSSARNISLYGSDVDYSSDQEPSFSRGGSSGASSKSFGDSAPGFIHPPIDLKDTKAFSCDICGKDFSGISRSGWQ